MPYAYRHSPLQAKIGQNVRFHRTMSGATAGDFAATAGISAGMLSKIERGTISPSLTTLQSLSTALGLPLTALFQGCEKKETAIFTPAPGRVRTPEVGKGGACRILGRRSDALNFVSEPYHIILTKPSDRFPTFHRGGIEFIYVVNGEFIYGHGDKLYHMSSGDSLLFHTGALHGPVELISLPIHLVVVVSYRQDAVRKAGGLAVINRDALEPAG